MTSSSETDYYQRSASPSSGNDEDAGVPSVDRAGARRTLLNFILMSVFFSANHGCTVSCLALATSQMGSVGAWQSGVLYIFYTGSAVLGATYVVKQLRPRNALVAGMALYCFYVACFLAAVYSPAGVEFYALTGAAIGGVGAGFLWTAQGSYFGRAAEDHASHLNQDVSESNSTLASIFAFLYLAEEVALRALSSVLLEAGWDWNFVFQSYTAVAVLSTILMFLAYDYQTPESENIPSLQSTSPWKKVSAAVHLLRDDPKMKYMIGLNAVFGFAGAFLNSYINGEVVKAVTQDDTHIGSLSAWATSVAAVMSLLFGKISNCTGKGPVLIFGALCFIGVAFPFVVVPNTESWDVFMLIYVYACHGTGRATFESTLKATFADFFPQEKEGAFANIILQNGLSGAIGYVLTFTLKCSEEGPYCTRYSDGSLHNVFLFELLVIITAVAAVAGYLRAAALHEAETAESERVLDNEEGTDLTPLADDQSSPQEQHSGVRQRHT